ncbi:ClbS/DfsB family four-helix bundle protein [Nostoc sp. CHAB 5715]|nr:ClbS/DfsB family four-helix bundle protein [Nostoc sp. CHAB 5836]MCC5621609.1 ClbS/DfsB family four-helix bundle protein [Nostoc sp. CHAB 5715]
MALLSDFMSWRKACHCAKGADMTIPETKTDLLAAIAETFDRLLVDLQHVPADRADEQTLPGHMAGTKMSPADLVAYLLGWNELVLKWLDRDDHGQKVDFPELDFQWNQLGLLAQKFYADYPELGWIQRLEQLIVIKNRLVVSIEARSDAELYGHPWYEKWTKGRMIQLNTSSPYANARARIRKWLKVSGKD